MAPEASSITATILSNGNSISIVEFIRFPRQIYAWIGCNSSKFGSLYAAAPTRSKNTVSVTSLLGGGSVKTGNSIAHRIVIRTGLNVTLACNIAKDNPMLETKTSAPNMQVSPMRYLDEASIL